MPNAFRFSFKWLLKRSVTMRNMRDTWFCCSGNCGRRVESKRIALTNSVCEKLINSFFLSELFYSISIKIKYDVIIYFKIPITYFKTLY
ncbi:Uncharacterised protein [Mycobacteroides abscessus subsp. massiliense]|nr:Uncharacterised protein [Mycobacteroides abscessus subsp. massiliense]